MDYSIETNYTLTLDLTTDELKELEKEITSIYQLLINNKKSPDLFPQVFKLHAILTNVRFATKKGA